MINGNDSNSIKLYVSRWGGNDNNDGLTENTPLKTIQAAVNKLPKFNVGRREIKIAPGNYEESVEIEDFIGGKISLKAIDKHYKPTINEIRFRNCDKIGLAYIDTSDKIGEGLLINQCDFVELSSVTLNSNRYGAEICDCTHVNIEFSEINSNICGIQIVGSTASVRATTIKNADRGIFANRSLVFSEGNTISASTKYDTSTAQIIEKK